MEKTPIIKELLEINEEFRILWEEHEKLDKIVDEMSAKVYLTPEEEVKLKELKLKKLKGKEKLVEMIERYKKEKESG